MYSFSSKPSRQFCEYAARRLTVMYPFMRDALGTGYVSFFPPIFVYIVLF
jgi:hypothetical protein